MDDDLRHLERRAAEDPADPGPACALARALLRAGDPLRALQAVRGLDAALHEESAAALATELGWELEGLDPCEVLRDGEGKHFHLIPAGAYLEEGPHAWSTSLRPGGARAPLRRVTLEAYLIERHARPSWTPRAEREGLRLPTPQEWKKAWRGGLFLDGDRIGLRPNPHPDRLRPSALEAGQGLERSEYGVVFMTVNEGREWSSEQDLCALASDGRYRVPDGRGPGIPPPGLRLVRPLG